MTAPSQTRTYSPPPAVQRATIRQLNLLANRALYQNAAVGNEALTRAIRAVQVHSSEELAKSEHID